MTGEQTRTETDSMGQVEVPAWAYYGAQTARAASNFQIGDKTMPQAFVRALAMLKGAAAQANMSLKKLDQQTGTAIVSAAQEIVEGKYNRQFPVSVYQTGSGTSSNMNVNEVIATRANEVLTGVRSSKGQVHPNDHVNLGQSSNDIVPTAIHLAVMLEIRQTLIPALEELEVSLRKKACEFWPVIKTGRTHLQDATPIRLGQEFLGFADAIKLSVGRTRQAVEALGAVALGGTAVGTGINCDPAFPSLVLKRLAEATGLPLRETQHHFVAQSTIDELVAASGVLRTTAVALMKIANDTRWMASGPRAGFGELQIPDLQPGSSIMPGKVNPVMAESLLMVCMQVIGYDATVVVAGQSGNFELNVSLPVVAYDLLDGIEILAAGASNFSQRAVEGMTATDRGPDMVEKGLMLVTALAPTVGYDVAAKIAKEANTTGQSVRDVARSMSELSEEQLSTLLNPESMVEQRS